MTDERTEPLFVNKADLARRLGVEMAELDECLMFFTEHHNFPDQYDFPGLFYWPAVRAFFDQRYGCGSVYSQPSALLPALSSTTSTT